MSPIREIAKAQEVRGMNKLISSIDMSNEKDMSDFLSAIILCSEMLGLQDATDEYLVWTANTIQKTHPDITLEELILAFELLSRGKVKTSMTSQDMKYLKKLEYDFLNQLIHNYKTFRRNEKSKLMITINENGHTWEDVAVDLKKESESAKRLILKAYMQFLGEEKESQSPLSISLPHSFIYNILEKVYKSSCNFELLNDRELVFAKSVFSDKKGFPYNDSNDKHIREFKRIKLDVVFDRLSKSGKGKEWLLKWLSQFFLVESAVYKKHKEFQERINQLPKLVLV